MASSSSSTPHQPKDSAFKANLSLSATVAANHAPPQSTIFNMGDKDLVIIDNQDIHESTCNDRARLVPDGSHHHHQQQPQQPAMFDKGSAPLRKYSDMAAGRWDIKQPTHEPSAMPSPTQLLSATTPAIDDQSNRYDDSTPFGRDTDQFPALTGGGRKSAGGNRGHNGNDNTMDLADVLGTTKWSADATQWSASLNNSSSYDATEPKQPPVARKQPQPQPSYSASQRNRSSNVLSHLGGNQQQQQHQRPRGDADEAGLSAQTANNKSTTAKSKCGVRMCVAHKRGRAREVWIVGPDVARHGCLKI